MPTLPPVCIRMSHMRHRIAHAPFPTPPRRPSVFCIRMSHMRHRIAHAPVLGRGTAPPPVNDGAPTGRALPRDRDRGRRRLRLDPAADSDADVPGGKRAVPSWLARTLVPPDSGAMSRRAPVPRRSPRANLNIPAPTHCPDSNNFIPLAPRFQAAGVLARLLFAQACQLPVRPVNPGATGDS